MKMNFHSLVLLAAVIISAGALGFLAAAEFSGSGISYPVAELGNCANQQDCKTFCDRPNNTDACAAFAEKNNMTAGDIGKLEQLKGMSGKPGNCATAGECESYCDDVSHINECVSFAEKNSFMQPSELEEAKKLQAALAGGAKLPGGCKSKGECDSYCNNPDHMEECITFGEAAGVIPADELDDAKKVLQAIKNGAKPPPCGGKAGCDSYCNEPSHMEECITFGEAAGLIPAGEADDTKKMLQAIKSGAKPPNCRGKAECDAYCAEPSHTEECITFAEAAGFMSHEDAEMAKKTGGVGPGGCRSKEACDAFCNNPENQETCFNFGMEHGMIPQAELQQMEEGKKKMQESLTNAPPEVVSCLAGALGQEKVDKLKAGTGMPSREAGDRMRECWESYNAKISQPQIPKTPEATVPEGVKPQEGGAGEPAPTPQPTPEPAPVPAPAPAPAPAPSGHAPAQ